MSRLSWLLLPVLLLTVSPVLAYVSPGQPTGYVNDYADILTPEQEATLEAKLQTLEASNGSEIAVVTIASLEGDTIENFAVSLFAEWGIGKKETDNGLLLLVAIEEREIRIEVGYGLEGTITDAQSYWIIRDILTPAFKNGDYYTGISSAVDIITGAITRTTSIPTTEKQTTLIDEYMSRITPEFLLGVITFFGIILGITRSYWLGGLIGTIFGGIVGTLSNDSLTTTILFAVVSGLTGLLFDYLVSQREGPGGGSSSGGMGGRIFTSSGGSGRSSGGFGGFGGGSSGGGGASGRW
jgi:uncharacterized protein